MYTFSDIKVTFTSIKVLGISTHEIFIKKHFLVKDEKEYRRLCQQFDHNVRWELTGAVKVIGSLPKY